MVWIPTKALEKKSYLRKVSISQAHRIRLFSDSSTISEGSEEESQPGSVDVPSSPTDHPPNRGDIFLTQSSAENNIGSPTNPLETSKVQDTVFWDSSRPNNRYSVDTGDGIPLAEASKNTYEKALLEVLTSLNVSKAISQKSQGKLD